MARVINGTIMYTGGGIYVGLGKLDDGNYVISDNFGAIEIYNSDVTEEI